MVACTTLQAEWIALTHNAILLTHNQSDFEQIVELRIEDWTTVD
jgi:predicted nucleic acid-binding protein